MPHPLTYGSSTQIYPFGQFTGVMRLPPHDWYVSRGAGGLAVVMVVNVGFSGGAGVGVGIVGTQRPAQFSPRMHEGSVRSQMVPVGQGVVL